MKKCSTFLAVKDANQNYFKISSHHLEWPYSRAKTTTNTGKDMVEPSYTVNGNAI
jgi:hypothetical protein